MYHQQTVYKQLYKQAYINNYVLTELGVVTATLLITEKPSVTFILERLNTWGSLILQENA